MRILLQLFILSMTLYASNPAVYSSLGDTVYNNLENIKALKNLKAYEQYKEKINKYTLDVEKTKVLGFDVESGAKSNLSLDYLNELRTLSKVNDHFVRIVNINFVKSIKTKDNDLFIGAVNSKILDTEKNKNKIMYYYKQNKDFINADGVIQKYLDEEKAYKKKTKKYATIKKEAKDKRIQRIRENDQLKQEALENKLEQELEDKKRAIRETQEKELFN